MGYVLRAEEMVRRFAADFANLENVPASDMKVKQFKHQEVGQEGKLLVPCAGRSLKLIDLLQTPTRRNARQGKRGAK